MTDPVSDAAGTPIGVKPGEHLTLGDHTYTFVDKLTGAPNEILLGSTVEQTLDFARPFLLQNPCVTRVNGTTIELDMGQSIYGPVVGLVGFNAPETFHA